MTNMIEFNKKQKEATIKIENFLNQNDKKFFYLFGYAGTGKTLLISKIINDLVVNNKIDHIYICAPTHKALKVIESYIMSTIKVCHDSGYDPINLMKISFMTIHKLLEFRPVIVPQDGSKIFRSIDESKFIKKMGWLLVNKLIIIDECSMISSAMVIKINDYINLYPIKIIYLGDRQQLPPVGEPISKIFSCIPENYEFLIDLDEIMRTKNSVIKNICLTIRNIGDKKEMFNEISNIYHHCNKDKIFKLYHKKNNYTETNWFKNFIKQIKNGNLPIILSWKNVTVDNYNKIIRTYIHAPSDPNNLNDYIEGDYAIFNNYHKSESGIYYYTSDMFKILKKNSSSTLLFDWNTLLLNPSNDIEIEYNDLVTHISGLQNTFIIDFLTISMIYSGTSDITRDNYQCIKTIARKDLEIYKNTLENIKMAIEMFFKKNKCEKLTNILWNVYHHKIIDLYAEIIFGYSITIYKAQGSTFSIVAIDLDDINETYDNMQQALYTAAGRASDELWFLLS